MSSTPTNPNGSGAHRARFALGAAAAAMITILFATVGDGVATSSQDGVLLEHGHTGVWALLTAALATAAVAGRWQRTSTLLAGAALVLYLTFLVALLGR